MNILPQLTELLRISPGQTARYYGSELKVDRYFVNSAFYSNKQLFEANKDANNIPRWYLKQNERGGPVPNSVNTYAYVKAMQVEETGLYTWQEEALAAWNRQSNRGVVEAVTGAGKTRVGIHAIVQHVNRGGHVLVIVPSLELLSQWERNVQVALPDERIGLFGAGSKDTFANHNVIISTINGARKPELMHSPDSGLLIADECHRLGSDINKDALDGRFTRRLGLSATYQRNDNGTEDCLKPYFGSTCFTLDYQRAISDRIISEFSVALVGVKFDTEERHEYEELSKGVSKWKRKLVNEYGLPEEPYGEFRKALEGLKRSGSEGSKIAGFYEWAFNKRRKLLTETPAKITGLQKLLGAIRIANGVIIFTETKNSAEQIAEFLVSHDIEAQAVHSGTNMNERKSILAGFASGEIRVIVAPRILDEGIDVPEADLAIIIASSKTRRQMIQRMGRVLRLKKDGRQARFALIFIEDTSEDPNHGAHEEFIEEITKVASSVKTFESHAAASEVCNYLAMEDRNPRKTKSTLGLRSVENAADLR